MIVANKGGGKTKLVREFRKTLVRADGSKPPLIEVNCASIKSAEGFFNQIYHTWVDNGATLFCDEAHMLPQRLQEIFWIKTEIQLGELHSAVKNISLILLKSLSFVQQRIIRRLVALLMTDLQKSLWRNIIKKNCLKF